jgi:hypothetical protein
MYYKHQPLFGKMNSKILESSNGIEVMEITDLRL